MQPDQKVVFEHQGYEITEHPGPVEGEILYTVWSPEGKVVLGNRDSLEEAKRDLSEYTAMGGSKKFESVEALVKSKTYIKGFDIDPEIREAIGELNNMGYATVGSCAGHDKYGDQYYGFINFANPDLSESDKDAIQSILQDHNLTPWEFKQEGDYLSVHFRR